MGANKRHFGWSSRLSLLLRGSDKYGGAGHLPELLQGYPLIEHIPWFLTGSSERERQVKRSFDLEHARYVAGAVSPSQHENRLGAILSRYQHCD